MDDNPNKGSMFCDAFLKKALRDSMFNMNIVLVSMNYLYSYHNNFLYSRPGNILYRHHYNYLHKS